MKLTRFVQLICDGDTQTLLVVIEKINFLGSRVVGTQKHLLCALVPACTFVSEPPDKTSLPDINPMFVTRYGVCQEGGSFSPSFGVCIPNDQGK